MAESQPAVRAPVRISGFTFLRNGATLGYPFEASIRSVLPLVDEFVVALGAGADDTRARIVALGDPRIRIIDTVWNESMRRQGFVYGQQKMIAHFCCSGDWAFYLEGDEVVHERDLPAIRAAIEHSHDDERVEALAFNYLHFFGSPHWVARGPGWYRTAVRIIRNTCRAFSPDGLFFTVADDGNNKRMRYPRAIVLPARIHHYGHVRPAAQMNAKTDAVSRYWAATAKPTTVGSSAAAFDRYRIDPRLLVPYAGSHPAAVQSWLASAAEQSYTPDASHVATSREKRQLLKLWLEEHLGLDLSRKHYRKVEPRPRRGSPPTLDEALAP